MSQPEDIQLQSRDVGNEVSKDDADASNSSCEKNTLSETDPATVFDRYINFLSIINFGFTLQAGWETVGLTFQFALLNGGPASLVYGCILAGVGSTAIACSLAEMASTDPTVGAQYRWSAKFAYKWKEFFGLIQGWLTVFAWIVNVGGSLAVLGNMVEGLIIFNNPTYTPKGWHTTLIMWAFIAVPTLCNLFLRRVLNVLETIGGICHVIFFAAVIITLVTLAERSTPSFVFATLTHNLSGWNNPGVAWNLGLLTVTFPITSFDGVLHMCDEVKAPQIRVPRSMVLSTTLNAIMQFAFVITLLFCVGDIDAVSSSALPIAEVYHLATKSRVAATILTCLHGLVFTVSLFNIFASVSRLVWAFSRDHGLPFEKVFSYVHPTLQIPLNALLLVGTIDALLALINIGSSTAFNALVSLPTIALYVSYFVPTMLILIRKFRDRHLAYGPWNMGRWGIPVNIFSLVYILYIVIWTPFPQLLPITATTFNYSGPILLAVIAFALLDWFTTGRKRFTVPEARTRVLAVTNKRSNDIRLPHLE